VYVPPAPPVAPVGVVLTTGVVVVGDALPEVYVGVAKDNGATPATYVAVDVFALSGESVGEPVQPLPATAFEDQTTTWT
jgi:hypothetical protein